MRNQYNRLVGLIVLLAGSLGTSGCDSMMRTTSAEESDASPSAGRDDTTTSTARPAEWGKGERNPALVWSSLAFPTGSAATSVVGIEQGVPREVRAGAPFAQELVVTNLTDSTLQNVIVSQQVDGNFKHASSTPKAQAGAGELSWNIGELGPHESRTISVSGSAGGEGAITCCTGVSYNATLCASSSIVIPKLRLTMTGPEEVIRCDEFAYSFELSNAGTGTVNNVKITSELPEGLQTVDGRDRIELRSAALGPGQSQTLAARLRAATGGTFESSAVATDDTGLRAESSIVATTVLQPALELEAECPGSLLIGREAAFKFIVKSTGDAPSAGTTLTTTVPPGLTFVRADGGGTHSAGRVTWNLGAMKPEDSRTVSLTLRTSSAGAAAVSATATGTCAAPVTDTCSTTVEGVPDIGTGIEDAVGVVLVGDSHVFTYTVKNQGQIDLTNVTMTATLSDGLEFVSSSSPTAPKASGQVVTWNLGTLKPGQRLSFTITTKAMTAGEQGISTSTRSDQLKQTVDNDEQVTLVDR